MVVANLSAIFNLKCLKVLLVKTSQFHVLTEYRTCVKSDFHTAIKQYSPTLSFFASPSIWLVGSLPIDRKQISGVLTVLSSQVFSKSKITGSAYLVPNESLTYFLA